MHDDITAAHEAQAREIFFEGIDHFEAQRLDQARACFERCLALTPGRPSALGNLGITLFQLGQQREAIDLLQQATAADSALREAWGFLGLAHEAEGAWQPALDALARSLALSDRSSTLRFSQGRCLMRLGRSQEALQAFDHAVAIDPAFTAAWSVRGSLLREMRQFDAAAQSFEQAMALGADPELHAYYLASVRSGEAAAPAKPPRRYVEALFDEYAAEFRGHVVDKLGYRGHEELLRPLIASGRRFGTALDLGCGTGLCAPLLQQCCERIVGVDLSAKMLEQAARLGLYHELVHADLGEFLAGTEHRADLVVAADVLIYVGEPSSVFASIARALTPGGVFAFTIELATDGADLQLLPSLRFAHSESAVRRLAAQCRLGVEVLRTAPIRFEQTTPVQGLYVHLRKEPAPS